MKCVCWVLKIRATPILEKVENGEIYISLLRAAKGVGRELRAARAVSESHRSERACVSPHTAVMSERESGHRESAHQIRSLRYGAFTAVLRFGLSASSTRCDLDLAICSQTHLPDTTVPRSHTAFLLCSVCFFTRRLPTFS